MNGSCHDIAYSDILTGLHGVMATEAIRTQGNGVNIFVTELEFLES
jgi:hypothetical protein